MLDGYTLSTTRFPSQSFDETGCDCILFHTPGKKDHISINPEILLPYFTPSQVMKKYGAYTASPARKSTSAIIEGKSDKSLQFQVNRLNIARDTSIKVQPKNSSQNFEFFIPSVTLTLIYLYKPLLQLQHEHPYQHSRNTNG